MYFYKYGDLVGPYNIFFIKEVEPYIKPNGKDKVRQGLFVCPFCKQEFICRLISIRNGYTRSCGCYQKQIAKRTYQKNFKKDLIGKQFGKLTVIKDTNKYSSDGHVLWLCQCDCGNFKEVSSDNLLGNRIISCGCSSSKGEIKISQILKNLNIFFIQQWNGLENNLCINPKTNYLLRFDFYLPDYNCCIEYDGEQHFKNTSGWNTEEHFKKFQFRDNIKNQYCKNNNIKLIRIPYIDFSLIDNNYILNLLKRGTKHV